MTGFNTEQKSYTELAKLKISHLKLEHLHLSPGMKAEKT